MDEKKLHTLEFQLKGVGGNMRCKLLQKMSTGKTTVFQTYHIENNIFSELNIFQISLKYIKLVVPILIFTSKLCNINYVIK